VLVLFPSFFFLCRTSGFPRMRIPSSHSQCGVDRVCFQVFHLPPSSPILRVPFPFCHWTPHILFSRVNRISPPKRPSTFNVITSPSFFFVLFSIFFSSAMRLLPLAYVCVPPTVSNDSHPPALQGVLRNPFSVFFFSLIENVLPPMKSITQRRQFFLTFSALCRSFFKHVRKTPLSFFPPAFSLCPFSFFCLRFLCLIVKT